MKPRLIVPDSLRDLIRHLPPGLKKKIKLAFHDISENPDSGKPLVGKLEGLWSYKVGKVRIIYKRQDLSSAIVAIGPRKTIYQKMTLEMTHRGAGAIKP